MPTSPSLRRRFGSFALAVALLALQLTPAVAAEITTDLWVYQTGDTVTVTGVDYAPLETVEIVTTDPHGVEVDRGQAQADSIGGFTYAFVLTSDVPGIYDVVATGQSSGLTAATQFDPGQVDIGVSPYSSPFTSSSGFDVVVSGTYRCSSGCTANSANNIVVQVYPSNNGNGVSGSGLLATPVSVSAPLATSGSGTQPWSATIHFLSPSGGDAVVPGDGKYDIQATFTFVGGSGTSATNQGNDYFTVDHTAPSVLMSSPTASPTNANFVVVNIAFSEPVFGFDPATADVTVANATKSNFSGGSGDQNYSFRLNRFTDGAATANIAAAVATDAAGFSNTTASQFSLTFDQGSPSVALSSASGNPTSDNPIHVTVHFSEDVAGFIGTDVTLGNGTLSNFNAIDGDDYEFDLNPTASPVTASVGNARAQDAAGNGNSASALFSRIWVSDNTVAQPTLLLPADNSFTNDNTPAFDWTTVTDPASPVTYAMQFVAKGATCDFTGVTVHASATSDFAQVSSIGADGVYCWRAEAIDNLGNHSGYTTAFQFTLDTVRPIISASRLPAANANGWNSSDVTVSFTCADALSGVLPADNTVSGDDQVFGEGAAQSVTSLGTHCVDQAGNAALDKTVSDINVDKTGPIISASRLPAANANGWNSSDVTVSFTCADALSGVLPADNTVSGDDQVFGEGAAQSVTSLGTHCVDQAGNAALDKTVSDINVDKTGPIISASRLPAANANGWNSSDVTVSFTCADALSGVLPADNTVSGDDQVFGEGAAQSVTSLGTHCVDQAGNAALDKTVSDINVDKTGPIISASRLPAANANGWNSSDVTVSFTCADALSGVLPADNTVSGDDQVFGEGAAQSVTSLGTHCVDQAGNAALDKTVSDINVDKSPPTDINYVGTTLADGGTYYFGFVPAGPSGCTANFAISGEDTFGDGHGCDVSGYSAALGPHDVLAAATDKAGNTGYRHLHYSVASWTVKGFYQPVDMFGTYNIVKGGSTVPMKFEIFAGASELTSTSYIADFEVRKQLNCNSSLPWDEIEVTTSGATVLRYDSTAGQFIQNWQTAKAANQCYTVTMTALDGSTLIAYFRTK